MGEELNAAAVMGNGNLYCSAIRLRLFCRIAASQIVALLEQHVSSMVNSARSMPLGYEYLRANVVFHELEIALLLSQVRWQNITETYEIAAAQLYELEKRRI